jgi:hypothetical protein
MTGKDHNCNKPSERRAFVCGLLCICFALLHAAKKVALAGPSPQGGGRIFMAVDEPSINVANRP